uniref:Ovule protein n=1 Tax=Heterorhabditis bacteriophora TaxID=37862 RepID=A0A1I7XMH5_HETBA
MHVPLRKVGVTQSKMNLFSDSFSNPWFKVVRYHSDVSENTALKVDTQTPPSAAHVVLISETDMIK